MPKTPQTGSEDDQLVVLATKVPAEIADEIKDRARRADRSVSAEIRRVLRDEVEGEAA